jgi:DNA-binding HxlR family transcriptional regulator
MVRIRELQHRGTINRELQHRGTINRELQRKLRQCGVLTRQTVADRRKSVSYSLTGAGCGGGFR